MNQYLTLEAVKFKVGGDIRTFEPGKIIKLTEQSAKKLVEAGKIRQFEPQPQHQVSMYKLRAFDLESERRIGAPCPNPNGYKCWKCQSLGERYTLAQDETYRWWWGWVCCKCVPYNPEQN